MSAQMQTISKTSFWGNFGQNMLFHFEGRLLPRGVGLGILPHPAPVSVFCIVPNEQTSPQACGSLDQTTFSPCNIKPVEAIQ